MKKNEAHDMVVQSLTEALLQLMEKKPLVEINVSELCERAGVSRVSFYRNYGSIQSILVSYLCKCTDDWWAEFSIKPKEEFFKTFWSELINEYKKHEQLIRLIYDNNSSYLLKEHIFGCCRSQTECSELESYARAGLAGMVYGFVDEWVRKGMDRFPEGFCLKAVMSVIPD